MTMTMTSILTLILFLAQLTCKASNDFDRLPKPPVNYRYFADEFEDTHKILGSCSEVKNTSPKSRCVMRINHKYSLKFVASDFSEQIIGSGTIIQKSIDNNIRSVTILTAFHIIIPQTKLAYGTFVSLCLFVILFVIPPLIIYIRKVDLQELKKIVLFFLCYTLMCSCIGYCFLLFTYPFLFNSSFRLSLLSNDLNRWKTELSEIRCEIKSSRMIFSGSWWHDIALIQCSNFKEHLFTYLEVCKPKLDNSLPMPASLSVNVIGFVGRSPISFDLVVNPYFSSYLPLITIDSINGKTPENFLLKYRFMNCTGTLRLTDQRALNIDTPSTYGFTGGPCFLPSYTDEWEFIGMLTGASRLWNKCTLLQQSTVFNNYYHQLIENERKQQRSKVEF